MRAPLVAIVVALVLLAPASAIRAPLVPELPADLSNAQLLRLLSAGTTLAPQATQAVDLDALPELTDLVVRVGARTGATLSHDDVAMFATLDARVNYPVRIMLAAIDQAWVLRDQAFAQLTDDEQMELAYLASVGQLDTPRGLQLVAGVDEHFLVESAILLLDTTESIALPLLKDAIAQGAWPATPTADPVGILRLGGTGNDVETLNRVLQIDPRGDDLYRNNAGGTNLRELLINPAALRYQVAVSIDFFGNDQYNKTTHEAQGGGNTGIGILLDYEGSDLYYCLVQCQGAGSTGIGVLHDSSGNDRFYGGFQSTGLGESLGLGLHRDDEGTDLYLCSGSCGGFGFVYPSTGLLWDRQGLDTYASRGALDVYGWGSMSGRGWFVDEGTFADIYQTSSFSSAGNDRTWLMGNSNNLPDKDRGGRGNDNNGGLAFLMTRQGSGLV